MSVRSSWGIPKWYALVLLGPPAVAFVAAVLAAMPGGPSLSFGGSQVPEGLPAPLVGVVFGGPLGEEVGWRGYALPRMQEKRGALSSALILGAVWAFWHLPLFFVSGTIQSFLPFIPFVAGFVSLSVIFAWAYNGSGGSLLVCLLLHGAGIFAILPARAVDSALPFYVFTVLILLVAAAVATLTGLAVERGLISSSPSRSRARPPVIAPTVESGDVPAGIETSSLESLEASAKTVLPRMRPFPDEAEAGKMAAEVAKRWDAPTDRWLKEVRHLRQRGEVEPSLPLEVQAFRVDEGMLADVPMEPRQPARW